MGLYLKTLTSSKMKRKKANYNPLKGKTEAELKELLKDPNWRIRNLYKILDKTGKKIHFTPNEAQELLLNDIWFRNLILKARQRGFSTLIQLMMLDQCLFNPNTRAGVIAQNKEAAGVIFRDKIKFAYDNLPQTIRDMMPIVSSNTSEMMFANNSSVRVATSMRSGTLQFLHISEFGKIAAEFPKKAREIRTGSLPSVDASGIVFIESTADGQGGAFHEMAMTSLALHQQSKKLSKLDYKFHFYSWYDADEYELNPDDVIITAQDNAEFQRLEADLGITISKRKRAWYVKKRETDFGGDKQMMKQEYPTTPEEAFEQSLEGTYYADQLAKARLEQRIGIYPYDPRLPVNTFWDLGVGDTTSIWFHQYVNGRNHWINFYEADGEPYSHYVKHMQELGYVWGSHYLPHDGDNRIQGVDAIKTHFDMLEELGLKNLVKVPRTKDVVNGIQQTRDAFHNYYFDEVNCADGIMHLTRYRKEWSERLQTYSAKPLHDIHSNASDAIRQHAQYFADPDNVKKSRPRRRNKGGMAV